MRTRSTRSATVRGGALVALGLALAATVPAGPATGQSAGESGYDFLTLHALADGVTVDFNLEGFLPIEDLVGLSSITSESHFGAGRSDSLAALPDPGDLILTLPGTLSALVGIPGIPDYPAAASADNPARPVDDVQVAPDGGLGAGKLHAEAGDAGASAFAHIGNQVDTVGLLPAFSIGSVRTTARTVQVNATTLESVATTTVSDVKLLGGLLSISQITSEVTAEIVNDTPKATLGKVAVSGATLAGTPVGITEEGIVGLGPALALAPVIDSLVRPLVDQGIRIRTTPSTKEVGDRTAVARGGSLEIQVPVDVQGYPGALTITLGRALAELEVGALTDTGGTPVDGGGTSDGGGDLGGVGSFDPGLPGLGGVTDPGLGLPSSPEAGPAAPGAGGGTEIVSVPVGRIVADWDVATLYRVMLLGGIALFAAGQIVVRSTLRPRRRPNDLRQLWRW
jgi:hypothetical protein